MAGAFVPNGVWPAEYDNKYFYVDFVFGNIYYFGDEGGDCAKCNPAKSNKDSDMFPSYSNVIPMRFGSYIGGKMALDYTSSGNGGVMMQVVCSGCIVVSNDLGINHCM